MSIATEQQYLVRLSIQATATDPSDAVQDVLEQVLHGGLENFTYSVEEVGVEEKLFDVPTHHAGSEASGSARGTQESLTDLRYRGEFLG